MTGIWIGIGLCVLALLGYMFFSIRKLSVPTTGAAIDKAARPGSALVVIDVQEDFTRNTGKNGFDPGQRDAALTAMSREIAAARAGGDPVAFVSNVFRDWPVILAMKLAAGGIGTPGREGLKLDRSLDAGSAPQFEKSIGDTFSNPQFEAWLEANSIGRLVLVGLDSCHCVQLTARGALNRGYEVEIRDPATLTTAPAKWQQLKMDLGAAGVVIA